jgi:hypothetical protein
MKTIQKTHMVLSPQQKSIINALIPVARVATNGSKSDQSFRPLTPTMIVGPSGSGKSWVARELAKIMGLPSLVINVETYVVTSARSEPYSMTSLISWLATLENGGILILDELDKLGEGEECSWDRHVRLELHDILDGNIPISAKIPGSIEDSLWGLPPNEARDNVVRVELEERLRNRVMIVGCGAWQHAWSANGNRLGFSPDTTYRLDAPSNAQILESIAPELRQRFRDEVLMILPMRRDDYYACACEIEKTLKPDIRSAWKLLLGEAIERAIKGTLGMRAFEELMLQSMIHSMGQTARKTIHEDSFPHLG